MRIIEIIIEASKAEKERRAKLSAKSKRANAMKALVAPVQKSGIPANVPPRRNMLSRSPAIQRIDPSEISSHTANFNPTAGIVLRFHKDNTGLYAYWAHSFALTFDDAKQVGTIKPITKLYSADLLGFIRGLIKKEGAVHLYIDQQINSELSDQVQVLQDWVDDNQEDSAIGDKLNFEIGREYTSSTTQQSVQPTKISSKTAISRIPNADILEKQIVNKIKSNPELIGRFTLAQSQVRRDALDAGIALLHKTKDVEAAVDEVMDNI